MKRIIKGEVIDTEKMEYVCDTERENTTRHTVIYYDSATGKIYQEYITQWDGEEDNLQEITPAEFMEYLEDENIPITDEIEKIVKKVKE